MPDFPAVVQVSTLNGTTGFRIDGSGGEELGVSVASAGDVNGDGFDDLIIGGWLADGHGVNSGNTYVVFGSTSGFPSSIAASSLNGTNGFVMRGLSANDASGFSLAGVGDINGDGVDDMLIGAPYSRPNGPTFYGGGYVVYGNSSGFAPIVELSALDGSDGFRLTGTQQLGIAGESVAGGGDLNNDGLADLVIGAYLNTVGGFARGETFVIYGSATGFDSPAFNLADSDVRIPGIDPNDQAGWSVDNLGDFNGDGIDDLIIGAPGGDPGGDSGAGESYIVFGGSLPAAMNLDALNGFGVRLDGIASGDTSGFVVASAGDINGDGYDDVIVGAPSTRSAAGDAYVVFGRATPPSSIDLSALNGTNGFRIAGIDSGDQTGFSVASAGDVNGDGYADLIVGATRGDPHGSDSGETYVLFGHADGFTATLDPGSINGANGFRIDGTNTDDRAGNAVASAGDVNGDGLDDLIVGARNANGANGAAYLVFGRAPSTSVNRIGTVASQSLVGGAGDDTLDARDGDDRLFGNAGDDNLIGGAGADMLSGGDDDDSLSGGSGADKLYGGAGSDALTGGSGNDVLDGGTGGDRMDGGSGDDLYRVDSSGDRVTELDGNGTDTVQSSASFSLAGQAVELLVLTGNGAINGSGNALANTITGNGAANTLNGAEGDDLLDGGGGADMLYGGNGDDRFVVDNAGDKVFESAGAGNDTVTSSVSFSLAGQNVETLVLTGSAAGGTGNSLANTITGNAVANTLAGADGNDRLDGGLGADTMTGGLGDDVFIVDNVGDKAIEAADQGYDRVESGVTFSLAGQNVEELRLTGSGAINGTGNSLANLIIGNLAANLLNGGSGDDQLHGGLGNDQLRGSAGADGYWFDTMLDGAANVDAILDFSVADDTIYLDRAIFTAIATAGTLDSGAFVIGTAAADADDRIVYDKAAGMLYYDADGAGGADQILFASVTANAALTFADFVAQ